MCTRRLRTTIVPPNLTAFCGEAATKSYGGVGSFPERHHRAAGPTLPDFGRPSPSVASSTEGKYRAPACERKLTGAHTAFRIWNRRRSAPTKRLVRSDNHNPLVLMKTPHYRTLTAAVCTLALLASPAAFAGQHDDAEKMFKKMDADGDGKVTRTEHAAGAKEMFTKCDANKDGLVTAAEMDAAMDAKSDKSDKHHKGSAEKIKMMDTNGDGQLSLVEHDAGTDKMFAKMDTNSDGTLSKEECADGHKEMKKDK
jgi:Ca2+-binding EF-hand superfamily protein